jgi:glycosyltransferase involved in cell wall biosynthesis
MNQEKARVNSTHPIILFAIGSLVLGGSEKQMVLLINHLYQLNFNCHLFVLQSSGPLKNFLRKTNVKIYDGGYLSEKSVVAKILLLLRAQLRLCRVIWKIRPDIIHAYLPLTNFMGSVAGRLLKVPLIITSKRALGTHQDRYRGSRICDITSFRLSTWITVNSKAVGEDTIKRDRGNADKMRLIYNGVKLDEFAYETFKRKKIREGLHLGPEKKIIITVANLIPYKGHIDLLKAATRVTQKFSDSLFLLVGEDRGIRNNLVKLAQELKVVNHILFVDRRDDISDLMAASDISVLPSHEEGFSNVVLESMAAGLPVVATRVGGNPEAIIDGTTGWLVPPHNPKELANKIVDLLNDPQKAKRWGELGKIRIKENFLVEMMVEGHLKLYNSAGLKNAL